MTLKTGPPDTNNKRGKSKLVFSFNLFCSIETCDRMNKKRSQKNPISKPYKPKYLRHALLNLSGLPIQTWSGKQELTSAKRS